MAKASAWIPIMTLVFVWLLISSASATTDASDVSALQDLYRTLSSPSQLTGWKSKGGDPCEEHWKGVSCDGSSIIYIKLNGLDLGGYLGEQLNLMNLKQLDLSSNHIQGEIPFLLPPNATNIDLSCNDFNMSIPYTLNSMIHLRHLNFSHNALSGPIGNFFTNLHNLKQMDLSFNNFTGDLPSSFGNLTNLTGLYLQNNKFTGSVNCLANLTLVDLNIQNNYFSGIIPWQLKHVKNLRMNGNGFQNGLYPQLLVFFLWVIVLVPMNVLFYKRPSELAYVGLDILMDITSMCIQFMLEHTSGNETYYQVLHFFVILVAFISLRITICSVRDHGPGISTSFGISLGLAHITHSLYMIYLEIVGISPSYIVKKLGADILRSALCYHLAVGFFVLNMQAT